MTVSISASVVSRPRLKELQPAETLWVHVDEPIVNKHFDTLAHLDAAVAAQCVALTQKRDLVRGQAPYEPGLV
jgi:hypothetical protein